MNSGADLGYNAFASKWLQETLSGVNRVPEVRWWEEPMKSWRIELYDLGFDEQNILDIASIAWRCRKFWLGWMRHCISKSTLKQCLHQLSVGRCKFISCTSYGKPKQRGSTNKNPAQTNRSKPSSAATELPGFPGGGGRATDFASKNREFSSCKNELEVRVKVSICLYMMCI